MKILLDSTMLIDALRKEPASVVELKQLMQAGHILVTSAVNVGEVYSGIRPNELKAAEHFLREIETYPVTFEIARRAGMLRNEAARKGHTLQLDDMMVAATALVFSFPIVTGNVKDFKSTGVIFYGAGEN